MVAGLAENPQTTVDVACFRLASQMLGCLSHHQPVCLSRRHFLRRSCCAWFVSVFACVMGRSSLAISTRQGPSKTLPEGRAGCFAWLPPDARRSPGSQPPWRQRGDDHPLRGQELDLWGVAAVRLARRVGESRSLLWGCGMRSSCGTRSLPIQLIMVGGHVAIVGASTFQVAVARTASSPLLMSCNLDVRLGSASSTL